MKNSQISSFEKHIEMSLEHDLPIIIHSREAEKETKNIIKYYKKNSNLKGSYIVLQDHKNLQTIC